MCKICGTCKYNEYDIIDPQGERSVTFYCGNNISNEYGNPTSYDDKCEDWEDKDE